MKLNKFICALMAMALPLGFIACGSDDKEETPYVFPTPANVAKAAKYTFSSQETPIKSVSFGEGNSVIIEQQNEDGVVEYVVGTYTEQNGVYTVSSGGQSWRITVGDGATSVDVTITTNGNTVTVTATKTTASNSGNTDIIGDWKPFMTTLNLHKQGTKGTVTDELKGIDFQALKARAEKEGCKISEDFKDEYVVKTATFQGVGLFCVYFTSNKNYTANWRWKTTAAAGDLKFDWQDKDAMNNDFLKDGNASVKVYKEGVYAGECWLSMKSTIKQDNDADWDVEVIFRLTR